jgi:hypothetical protein
MMTICRAICRPGNPRNPWNLSSFYPFSRLNGSIEKSKDHNSTVHKLWNPL